MVSRRVSLVFGEVQRTTKRNEGWRAYGWITGDHEWPRVDGFEKVGSHYHCWWTFDCDFAAVEQHDCVGEAGHQIELMADEEYRQTGACKRREKLEDGHFVCDV